MSISSTTRRWLTPFVLTGYVLVATFSGLFHQHGEGSCCSETGCVQTADRGAGSKRAGPASGCSAHGHHHHGSHHAHSGAPGHRHGDGVHGDGACGDDAHGPANAPSAPRSDDPLKHAHCAACQLLAEHSVCAPQIVLESTSLAVYREADAAEQSHPAILAPAHRPRGPPAMG